MGVGTKEVSSRLRENKEDTSFKRVLWFLAHNDQLMWLSFAYLLYGAGTYLTNTLMLYYFTYILGDPSKFSWLGIINIFIGLLSVSLFPSLAKKFHRRNVFILSISVMLLALVVFMLVDKSLPLVLLAGALFNLPQPLIFLVVLMTITDIVEYGQLKLGHLTSLIV
ncbi:MFS transporter [Sporolactobacillus shoreicorticis]|uniref:MFS transporter n=1 Tax=Sporolactobacillus shoreicorticis TaxID=1923877 RepID=A0ABW5S3J0_9BACL